MWLICKVLIFFNRTVADLSVFPTQLLYTFSGGFVVVQQIDHSSQINNLPKYTAPLLHAVSEK